MSPPLDFNVLSALLHFLSPEELHGLFHMLKYELQALNVNVTVPDTATVPALIFMAQVLARYQ